MRIASSVIYILHQRDTFVATDGPILTHVITQSPLFSLPFILSVVHAMRLDKFNFHDF